MSNIEKPKVESFHPQVFVELTPEIVNVDYDLWTLRITLSFSATEMQVAYVTFKGVIGFRMLDEGDLLEFWHDGVRVPGWIWKINSGGWFDLEKTRKGFVRGYHEDESRKEYLVLGQNDCLSVIAYSAPEIVFLE